jgi:hypothetical protein
MPWICKETAMDGAMRKIVGRLPLAEGVLWLWGWIADDAFLGDLYQRWRGRSYEKVLTFPTFVHLIADALLKREGSARQSFERADEVDALPTSIQAVYGKLRRVPIALSQAFLSRCTERMGMVMPPPAGQEIPASLTSFEVVILDGKTIKRLAKRLKPLRSVAGGVVGGKTVVALSLRSGLALAMQSHPDGHANEVRLVPGLLSQVRDLVGGARLWVGDRAYSYPERLKGFAEQGDAFVIRLRSDITFTPDADRPARKERDRSGRRVRQEWGWLGRSTGRHRIYVRRVTLERGEGEAVLLVTNLLDERCYPVTDLLDLYLLRWGIERVFQQVTEVFSLKHLIGSSPEASVFQFAFCLLLYNLLQVVRAVVAANEQRPIETISTEKLFTDVREHLIAWAVLIGPVITAMTWRKPPTPEQASMQIRRLLQSVWTRRWIKAPPRKRKPARPRLRRTTHVSAHKILVAYNKRCGRPPVGKR